MELIDVLYHLYDQGRAEEAKRWIQVAETEDIYPAKVAFLKGLILAKEGKYADAREPSIPASGLTRILRHLRL